MSSPSKTVDTFEDLHIFKQARNLTSHIWKITRSRPFSEDLILVNQVRRSTLSIVSNIAEGFERQSDKDFARFLGIAKGSCGEMRAQLLVAMAQKYITKDQYIELSGTAKQISARLFNLSRYLHNSAKDIRTSSAS